MADFNLSPEMNLPIPVVGTQTGPEWADNINSSLTIIDQHDHTDGSGVQITPDGLNINADLDINSNNLKEARSVILVNEDAPLSDPTDVGSIYQSTGDLYYNDANGTQIRITQNGGIAGTPGSISNLISPASASYVSADSTFVWESDTNIAAAMDNGPVTIRKLTVSSPGITLEAPSALASDYTISLPVSLPVSTLPLVISSSGNLSTQQIATAQIADQAVTAAKIQDNTITRQQLAAVGQQLGTGVSIFTTSSASYVSTGITVSITTTGRPVIVSLQPDGVGVGVFRNTATSTSNALRFSLKIDRNGTNIAEWQQQNDGAITNLGTMLSLMIIDTPTSGSYTYTVYVKTVSGNSPSILINNYQLVAYEL